jgi:tRNA(adenine34) deaminase
MCAAAISYARIGRLFYGASDPKQGAVENGGRFFTQDTCMHRPEIYEGIMSLEASTLMKVFFENLR